MQRHYGGVRGTILRRGCCPVCGRDTAGGMSNREKTCIWLKRHKRAGICPLGDEWCPGGGMVVPIDHDLTDAYAQAKRDAAAARRARWRERMSGGDP